MEEEKGRCGVRNKEKTWKEKPSYTNVMKKTIKTGDEESSETATVTTTKHGTFLKRRTEP